MRMFSCHLPNMVFDCGNAKGNALGNKVREPIKRPSASRRKLHRSVPQAIANGFIPNIILWNSVRHVRMGFAFGDFRSDRGQNCLGGCDDDLCFGYFLTRQFDDFLFARIDEGSDATPLSVLSMLARLDIDPWEEAAKLARLPRAAAARRLVDFIAATPGAPSAYLNAKTVSDRLLNLLPSPVLPKQEQATRALKKFPFVWLAVIVVIILAIC